MIEFDKEIIRNWKSKISIQISFESYNYNKNVAILFNNNFSDFKNKNALRQQESEI